MQGSHEVPPEIQAHLMSPRVPMNDFEVFLNESGVLGTFCFVILFLVV